MPRPADECLAASSDLIVKTRSKLAQLQFILDTCIRRIEVSADAIVASQALLAKLDGGARLGGDGAGPQLEKMMKGEGDVVTGWHNKLRSAISLLLPSGAGAELHRREAAPGTAR